MPSDDPIGAAFQRGGAQINQSASRAMAIQRHEQDVIDRENKAVADRLKRAEQHVEASIHETYLKEWQAKKVEGLRGRNDYANFDASFDADVKELNDYVGAIPDPEVKMAVTRAAQSVIHEHGNAYRVKKAAAITDIGKASLDQNLGYDLQEWTAASSDPIYPGDGTQEGPPISERDRIKGRMEERIMASAQSGIITEAAAVNMVQGLGAKTAKVYAKSLLNTNPERALQEIPNLKDLDPVEQQTMLSTAVIKIEQRDRQAEKAFKSTQEEAEQRVMDRIEAGDQAGATELLASYGKDRLLSPEKRRTLKTAIDAESKQEAKGDPDAFYKLEQGVLLGKASIKNVLDARDVSVANKNKLIRLFKDEKDPRKSYDYAEAMKSAHNEIITTGPLAALDPEQQSRFTAYKRAAEKNIQAGGDPWQFFDNNLWKYRPGIPATIYGTPKTAEDVNAQKARLRADVAAGKIKTGKAGMEAEKLETALDYITKRDKVKKNAGNK